MHKVFAELTKTLDLDEHETSLRGNVSPPPIKNIFEGVARGFEIFGIVGSSTAVTVLNVLSSTAFRLFFSP